MDFLKTLGLVLFWIAAPLMGGMSLLALVVQFPWTALASYGGLLWFFTTPPEGRIWDRNWAMMAVLYCLSVALLVWTGQ